MSQCCMSIISGVDHVWQRWITPQTTSWPTTTLHTNSAVTLDIAIKRLNHGPYTFCSGEKLMMMTQVWIWYPTVIWVLYETWTTSDRGGSPHRPHHDLELHPRHAHLLPWILEPRACSMHVISGIVIQWWWCRYGYASPPLHEYDMRHR